MKMDRKVSFRDAGAVVFLLIAIGFAIDKAGGIPKILSDFLQLSIIYKINLFIAIVGILLIIFRARIFLIKILTAPRFAVVTLLTIAIFTILGTLIIQNESYGNYLKVYNKSLVDFFYKMHLIDIFHSYYFSVLLFTLAVSLALVICRRKPFKLTQIGFTLTHGGTILILIGGLLAILYGEKGFLHLRKGEKPTNTMRILKNGKEVGNKNLDFAVSLDDFKVEYYDEGDKIYVYEKEKEGYRYLFRVDPEKTKEFQLPGGIRTIRIIKKNIYESKEENVIIPYFEIEVEKPRGISAIQNTDQSSPHHGVSMKSFSGVVQLILALGNPLPFDNNRYVIVFDHKKEPKLFQSILSIYENNEKKITSPIRVNSPLTYKGYKFYQSNYNPEDPGYSGILVVKDPGLSMVYIGFIMICLGIIYIFYVKPKIIEKHKGSKFKIQNTNPSVTHFASSQ